MKILKWLLGILAVLALCIGVFLYTQHEPKPIATPSAEADQLAQKMLAALNKPAWDTLAALKFEFPTGTQYLWDKKNNKAHISWGENAVYMNLDDQTGDATVNGVDVTGSEKQSLLDKAWSQWCNDSFWMFAPYKVFDPNTTRSIVKHEGSDALLVSYGGGGVTPGDAYLWILGDDYIPVAYKMWVKIIPVGGLAFTWQEWITLPGGAKLATLHESKVLSVPMKGVEEGSSITDWLSME